MKENFSQNNTEGNPGENINRGEAPHAMETLTELVFESNSPYDIDKVRSEVQSLAEEEGLIIEKDGHLLLEKQLKDKIIQAFKDEPSDENREEFENLELDQGESVQSSRILGSPSEKQKEAHEDKKTAAAVVKIIEEERKSKKDYSAPLCNEDSEESGSDNRVCQLIRNEKPTIANAEVLMVKGNGYAVGLSYSPGMIPGVVVTGKGKRAEKLINEAFHMDIPVVEVLDLDYNLFRDAGVGDDIPEKTYNIAAKALALVYKMKPDAHLVRFVKPSSGVHGGRRKKAEKAREKYRDVLRIPPVSLELADSYYEYREELKTKLDLICGRYVSEMGLFLPPVEVTKNRSLKNGEYLLKIKGITYDSGLFNDELEPPDVFFELQNHFMSLIYNFGYELLGYTETDVMVNALKKENPRLIKSLFPENFTIGALRFILRGLLREQIPIKDLSSILEVIEGNLQSISDPELLIEYIRASFSQYISNSYRDGEGYLNVILLSRDTERKIMDSIKETMNVRWLDLGYSEGLTLLSKMGKELKSIEELGIQVVILTSPTIRRFIRKITESSFPLIPVISYSEIYPLTPVKSVGLIDLKTAP